MARQTLHYGSYKPLYVNGRRDPAKRYTNDAGNTISVREFQKQAHKEAGTQRAKRPPLSEQERMARFYRVVERLGKGESLTKASKAEGLSETTVRNINEEKTPTREYNGRIIEGTARRVYSPKYSPTTGKRVRGFEVNTPNEAPVLVINPDGSSSIKTIQVDRININTLGRYWAKVDSTLNGDTPEGLERFQGRVVYDLQGNAYPLITDPDALYLAILSLPDGAYNDLWNRFNSGTQVATGAA